MFCLKLFEFVLEFGLCLFFQVNNGRKRPVLVSAADIDQRIVAKVIDEVLYERDVLADEETLLENEMIIDKDVRVADKADEVFTIRLGEVRVRIRLGFVGFLRPGICGGWFAVGERGCKCAAKFQGQDVFFRSNRFAVLAPGQERVHDLVTVKL